MVIPDLINPRQGCLPLIKSQTYRPVSSQDTLRNLASWNPSVPSKVFLCLVSHSPMHSAMHALDPDAIDSYKGKGAAALCGTCRMNPLSFATRSFSLSAATLLATLAVGWNSRARSGIP